MGKNIDTTPNASANFTPPDWVIVTRNGPVAFTTWNNTLGDASPNNTGFAVGRYAYAIYDEGGLLDMNVAGYPDPASSGLTPLNSARKDLLRWPISHRSA